MPWWQQQMFMDGVLEELKVVANGAGRAGANTVEHGGDSPLADLAGFGIDVGTV